MSIRVSSNTGGADRISFITGRGEGELLAWRCRTGWLTAIPWSIRSTIRNSPTGRLEHSWCLTISGGRSPPAFPLLDPGYWVAGSRKMEYKGRFTPQEHLGMRGWERVS